MVKVGKLVSGGSGSPALGLQVPQGGSGVLVEDNRWRLKAGSGARLRLSRTSSVSSEVALEAGAVDVRVRPGTMRRFAVLCQHGLRVVVRGTRFNIEQAAGWTRVEVTRGRVAVERAGSSVLVVAAGQGVRYVAGRLTRYPLPPGRWMAPSARLLWLSTRGARQLTEYATDLGGARHRSPIARRDLLEKAANLLAGQWRFESSSRMWLAISGLGLPAADRRTAFAAAAQACGQAGTGSRYCLQVLTRYVARYPRGMLREHVLYWLIRDLVRVEGPRSRRVRTFYRLYRQRHSPGVHRRKLEALLARPRGSRGQR